LAKRRLLKSCLVFACLLCLPAQAPAQGGLSIGGLRAEIEAFKRSEHYRFAPQTIARSEAYLGAAMLAEDQHQPDNLSSALNTANEKLLQAKQTSTHFQQQYSRLLGMEADAKAAVEAIAAPDKAPDFTVAGLIDQADAALSKAIQGMEEGKLNQSRAQAAQAMKSYRQALVGTIPELAALAKKAVSRAASGGAKKYAPVIFQAARDKLTALRLYIDGIEAALPEHPADTLALARKAREFAAQVKQWRRQAGSHEKLVNRERALRLQLAKALGIPAHANELLAEVSNGEILRAIDRLKEELAAARATAIRESRRQKQHYESELQRQLGERSDALMREKNEQLTALRDAFRAKLEQMKVERENMSHEFEARLKRETFEQKRQARVQALFRGKDASILVNLDGSLLIRLGDLKFESGKSKIDSAKYDLLGRLKDALDIYSDRNVRIEGHTDDRGEVKPNQRLSLKRAEAVRDFLIAAGVKGERLKALGYGEVRPIASNEFARGRALNRRIDIVITKAK